MLGQSVADYVVSSSQSVDPPPNSLPTGTVSFYVNGDGRDFGRAIDFPPERVVPQLFPIPSPSAPSPDEHGLVVF